MKANLKVVKKPQPPDDFWKKLDVEIQELKEQKPPRPLGSYTREEITDRYKWSLAQTYRRLSRLCKSGRMERLKVGRDFYYRFPNASTLD